MNLYVILITYAVPVIELVARLHCPDVTLLLFSHSTRPDVHGANRFIQNTWPNVYYYNYQTNRGLATSWNDGIWEARRSNADAILIVNDDVSLTSDDLLKLAHGCTEHPEAGIIVAEGYNIRMKERQILQFAIFGLNPVALDTIGYFDENFVPIYFEDTDYSRRAALAGVKFHNIGETGIVHKGSETVGSVPALNAQNHDTFHRNRLYYIRKWGGEPGKETFEHPFNDPSLGLCITAENRRNPYPQYQRTDKDVVKI